MFKITIIDLKLIYYCVFYYYCYISLFIKLLIVYCYHYYYYYLLIIIINIASLLLILVLLLLNYYYYKIILLLLLFKTFIFIFTFASGLLPSHTHHSHVCVQSCAEWEITRQYSLRGANYGSINEGSP